jgi:hypothetical protein
MGKSTINGSFSIAMLNYQRVIIIIFNIYLMPLCVVSWCWVLLGELELILAELTFQKRKVCYGDR